jgi:hypothetical protein
MTIFPFQNQIINSIYNAFRVGGINISELYFEQLTPLVILSDTAEDTDQTIEEVQKEIDDNLQGGEGEDVEMEEQKTDNLSDITHEPLRPSDYGFDRYYESN